MIVYCKFPYEKIIKEGIGKNNWANSIMSILVQHNVKVYFWQLFR